MGWLTIILAIIQAIPSILKLIQMIRDLLKGQPKEVRAAAAHELGDMLTRWRQHRNSDRTAGEVEGLLSRLRAVAKK